MKILFVAAFNPNSTNYSQSKCLQKIGNEVIEYEYRTPLDQKTKDKEIIELTKNIKPNLLLIAKGTGINLKTIKTCTQLTTTCLWFPDAVPHGHWPEALQKIRECTYACCDKLQAVEQAKDKNKNVFRVAEGFDPEIDKPYADLKSIDVSFIGNLYGNRERLCQVAGARIVQAYGKEHAKTVGTTKINLNFCTVNCASDRVYKILAAKGFLLTDDWYGREFKDGEELVVFNGEKDLRDKVQYYLSNKEERERIAENGYNEVQKYSRLNWANEIIRRYNDTI